jgi:hypothetical protein
LVEIWQVDSPVFMQCFKLTGKVEPTLNYL